MSQDLLTKKLLAKVYLKEVVLWNVRDCLIAEECLDWVETLLPVKALTPNPHTRTETLKNAWEEWKYWKHRSLKMFQPRNSDNIFQ